MEDRRVLAIDAGTRNFAYCVVDPVTWREPVVWYKEDLWTKGGKPSKEQVIEITHAWCRRNKALVDSCDLVVLEQQLRTTFIVQNAVIHALFFDKVTSVSPMTVGSFFHLPKTREHKKAATVALCQRNATMAAEVEKLDDLADAWMMAVWGLIKTNGLSIKQLL